MVELLKTHTKDFTFGQNKVRYTFFDRDIMARNSIGAGKEWEPHITEFIKSLSSHDKNSLINIVDIGANFGYHTVLFSKYAQGTVYAFEPQPQNYGLLEKNTLDNGGNIKLFNLALGDTETVANIPLFKGSDPRMHNMGDITVNHTLYAGQDTTDINVIPLDSLGLSDISLMKLDVQGYELKVLYGARETIERCKPIMIVEMENHQLQKVGKTSKDLIDLIRSMNYHIFFLDYVYPSDHVCVHNSQVENFRKIFGTLLKPHTHTNGYNHNVEHGINEKIIMYGKS